MGAMPIEPCMINWAKAGAPWWFRPFLDMLVSPPPCVSLFEPMRLVAYGQQLGRQTQACLSTQQSKLHKRPEISPDEVQFVRFACVYASVGSKPCSCWLLCDPAEPAVEIYAFRPPHILIYYRAHGFCACTGGCVQSQANIQRARRCGPG